MSGFSDDLNKIKVGLLHVFESATQLEQAATTVMQKAEAVADHMAAPATLERVAAASLSAAIDAAGREVNAAAAGPARPDAPASRAKNVIRCRQHGAHSWQGTIVCVACGRVFQMLRASAARFAPEVCPCGAQLLPGPHVAPYSGAPICTPCFTGLAAAGGRAVRRAT